MFGKALFVDTIHLLIVFKQGISTVTVNSILELLGSFPLILTGAVVSEAMPSICRNWTVVAVPVQ